MAQALLQGNVVAMQRKNRDDKNVGMDIINFLRRHNLGNENGVDKDGNERFVSTAGDYERDIRRFFKLMWGKTLNQLEVEDLDILPSHIEEYQMHLSQFYMGSTINRNINSLRSLYSYFESNRYRYSQWDKVTQREEWVYITANIFQDIKSLDTATSQGYGVFSHDEVVEMLERAKSKPNGERKSLALELASVTSFRLDAIASLKKSNFKLVGNTWVATVMDKKQENIKAVRTDLYERLMSAIPEGEENQDKVFNFGARTLQRLVEDLSNEMELDPDRNLTFHSLKKYGIGEVYSITKGDIQSVSQQGNHKSFDTTQKYYLMFSEDYSKMPCLQIGQPIDLTPFDDMSKEELLELILKSGRATQYELLNNAQK